MGSQMHNSEHWGSLTTFCQKRINYLVRKKEVAQEVSVHREKHVRLCHLETCSGEQVQPSLDCPFLKKDCLIPSLPPAHTLSAVLLRGALNRRAAQRFPLGGHSRARRSAPFRGHSGLSKMLASGLTPTAEVILNPVQNTVSPHKLESLENPGV